jgi:hypothetical protein
LAYDTEIQERVTKNCKRTAALNALNLMPLSIEMFDCITLLAELGRSPLGNRQLSKWGRDDHLSYLLILCAICFLEAILFGKKRREAVPTDLD